MNTSNRRTGRTTEQIRNAPIGALFVAPDVHYAKALAVAFGRNDLKIVGPGYFESQRWRGTRPSGVVVDHAVRLTEGDWETVQLLRSRCGQ